MTRDAGTAVRNRYFIRLFARHFAPALRLLVLNEPPANDTLEPWSAA